MYSTLHFFQKADANTKYTLKTLNVSWGLVVVYSGIGLGLVSILIFLYLFVIHLSLLITFKELYWRSYVSFILYKFDPFFFKERIFQDVGKGLLGHLFQGYNCTLFAYGQTGSGKSYTIMERGVNKGAEQYNFTVSGQCITTTSLFIA